ncbi:hypothetical protein C9F11_08820 [Streptomyces sp. YIM 121038]|uniref:hypothetical protein n=1 Tax=Streptomyces sp. YIM 121038 TaxID=2136401 RepID=UPI0011107FF6|nr:hypothetical protein [Streptomyces sp. YIM 121038]QCX75453.1 hypothetical protein C9F11_08820 [Streptomyces sp. YIM 121038]
MGRHKPNKPRRRPVQAAPIETSYGGYRFRSRLEARWAVFFNALGVRWEYEPEGYVLDGTPYLPDFKIMLPGDRTVFAEVKHVENDEHEGRHVDLCRDLADGTGHPVLLLTGAPGHRMYHQFLPGQDRGAFTAAFFRDHEGFLATADDYWFRKVVMDPVSGVLEFAGDERQMRKSFGDGLVEAVRAARSARFEHGERG